MTIDLTKIRELAKQATPGPWLYRPQEFDDWGLVRTANEDGNGFFPVVCSARGGSDTSDNATLFDQHRMNKTDPFGHNAAFIAAANPQTLIDLVDELQAFRRLVKEQCLVSNNSPPPQKDKP